MIYPPRPENAITPSQIQFYENLGFIGQKKMNGTCQVISIGKDRDVDFRTRHGEANKAWSPTKTVTEWFRSFPDSIFVGELLHSKHADVKDTIVIFDVLKYLGEDQIGTTLSERLDLLSKIVPITTNVQIVRNVTSDLTGFYHSLSHPLEEGIVLKNPKAKLRDYHRDGLNSSWQVKVRRPTKNYGF